jgi:hypothetical protein
MANNLTKNDRIERVGNAVTRFSTTTYATWLSTNPAVLAEVGAQVEE